MPVVPPELSDYIVDFLHNDQAALKACSLTCREWVPVTRFHLYRTIQLRNPQRCAAFNGLLERSPFMGHYVQELTIMQPPVPGPNPSVPWEWCSILPLLPGIKSLEVLLLLIDAKLQQCMMQSFTGLTRLVLQYSNFASFDAFAETIYSCPLLEHLTLRGVSWSHPDDRGVQADAEAPMYEGPSRLPRLKHLTISKDMDLPTLMRWLVSQKLHTNLESFAGSSMNEGHALHFTPLLESQGPSLRSLELDWHSSAFGGSDLPAGFTVGRCTSLRALTLRFPIYSDSNLSWMTSLLAQIRSTRIEMIILDVRLLGSLDAIDWARVERIISGEAFRSLKSLNFKILSWHRKSTEPDDVEGPVRSRLPGLHSKGLVHFAPKAC